MGVSQFKFHYFSNASILEVFSYLQKISNITKPKELYK